MPQNPSLRIKAKNVFLLPFSSFLPHSGVSLQQREFMNNNFGWKTCYPKASQYFIAGESNAAGEHATNLEIGEDWGEKRIHWYSCSSIYFLARNKKQTTKAIIVRSPLSGILLKTVHLTPVVILWLTLDSFLLKEWHYRASVWVSLLDPDLPFSPLFKKYFCSFIFNCFPFTFLSLYWFFQNHVQ